MKRDAGDDEPHAGHLRGGRHLAQHQEADHGRGGRKERDEQGVGRPRQPGHGELVADVRNDRGRHAHADPGAQEAGIGERRAGGRSQGHHRDRGCQHGAREAVDAGDGGASGHAVGGDDVAGEERGVHECEPDAERGAADLDAGDGVDAGDRQDERRRVPPRSHACRREHDDGKEFDRRDGAEREVIDGGVETRVHRREHGAHERHEPARRRVGGGESSPRPSPCAQDDRRAHDPKPRDTQRLDPGEQQDGEGRTEIVEDRAADEVAPGREPAHD